MGNVAIRSVVTPSRVLCGFVKVKVCAGVTVFAERPLAICCLSLVGPDGETAVESGELEFVVDGHLNFSYEKTSHGSV